MPEVGVSEEGACCKNHLPVKFNDPKLKNEENRHDAFILLKLFVCNQFFLLLKHFVACQKLIHVYASFLFLLYKENLK